MGHGDQVTTMCSRAALGGDSSLLSAKWEQTLLSACVLEAAVPPRILMWGWARWGDCGSPGLSHRDTTLSMLTEAVQWQGGLVLLQLPGGHSHPNLY